MKKEIKEEEALKILLLCCQSYQDVFERTLYNHEKIDFMNHSTVQGSLAREYAERLSKVDSTKVNSMNDLLNEVNKGKEW